MTTPQVRPRGPVPPLPLTILTGFLGSGKTTLLNALLKDPALAETAVLINEFGDIGLDHLLVERIDDNMVLLQSGCLCCTLRGDLITALEKLLRDRDNGRASFRRVILETTGLADPVPVLQTLMAHPYLVMRYRLDGVIATVDAVNGAATLDRHPESVRQAAIADRIVLTKTDLVAGEHPQALRDFTARLRRLNPSARILDAAHGEASAEALLDAGLYNTDRKTPDVRRWLAEESLQAAHDAHDQMLESNAHDGHAHHGHAQGHSHEHSGPAHDLNRHDERIRAFSVVTERPLAAVNLELFLDLLRSVHGPQLLRLKGIVKVAEHPNEPLLLHGVQHIFHPLVRLPHWPDDDHRTRLVFIVDDLQPDTLRDRIRAMLDAFSGGVAPDQPDRQALLDNPLVPFGGR